MLLKDDRKLPNRDRQEVQGHLNKEALPWIASLESCIPQ
jgi:hypothetical protein